MGVYMKDLLHNGPGVTVPMTIACASMPGKMVLRLSAADLSSEVLADRAANSNRPTWSADADTSFSSRVLSGLSFYSVIGKRALDLVLTVLSLPVTLPVMIICALALMIEGGHPFYTQERLGRNGKRFRILKLRTMVRDADACLEAYLVRDPALRAEWDATQKLKNDPRITRVGRLLRVTSLDELPQLWNVIKGEMSLVGPRPMMTDQLSLYGDPQDYFALKPGLTGLWQVSSRNESTFAFRAAADSLYYRDLGFASDIKLIWLTFGVVAKGTGY